MNYINISNPTEKVNLSEALLNSKNSNSGLYMPESIPVLPSSFFDSLSKRSLQEIALEVSKKMFGTDIPEKALEKIVRDAFTFDIPLKQLGDDLFVLELFHGPTQAFKDVGARFLAGLFEYLVSNEKRETTVLVATSGDTGSAIANAFHNRIGIRVVVLYPSGKVSEIQEKQLTTMGGNVISLEIDGNFDDCQRLVKMAFSDEALSSKFSLTSGNSINFGRLFPQSFYYHYAWSRLPSRKKPVAFSVPSGNFGNLTAGLVAAKMGLPVRHFIASTNSNHSVVDYLKTGNFNPGETKYTITNAMDVGNPSNFPRILSLYGKNHSDVCSTVKGFWFTDTQTRKAMSDLQARFAYQADPHGAVGYLGLKKYMEKEDCSGIFLETAHPAKFLDEVEKATGVRVIIPDQMKQLFEMEKRSVRLSSDFGNFKEFLSEHLG